MSPFSPQTQSNGAVKLPNGLWVPQQAYPSLKDVVGTNQFDGVHPNLMPVIIMADLSQIPTSALGSNQSASGDHSSQAGATTTTLLAGNDELITWMIPGHTFAANSGIHYYHMVYDRPLFIKEIAQTIVTGGSGALGAGFVGVSLWVVPPADIAAQTAAGNLGNFTGDPTQIQYYDDSGAAATTSYYTHLSQQGPTIHPTPADNEYYEGDFFGSENTGAPYTPLMVVKLPPLKIQAVTLYLQTTSTCSIQHKARILAASY